MKKVVINGCFGGFSLSPEACLWLFKKGFRHESFNHTVERYFGNGSKERINEELDKWRSYLKGEHKSMFVTVFTPDEKTVLSVHIGSDPEVRSNKLLVQCVETLGKKANGSCAELKIVNVPNHTDFVISEYDGNEHVAESHRTWD
jgi:hypothetical protein